MSAFIFYFDFYYDITENEDFNKVMGFSVENADLGKHQNFDLFISDIVGEIASEIEEEYGVHDWSSGPSEDEDGIINAIGYTSYEIEPAKTLEVMQVWKDKFQKLFKEAIISEIYELDVVGNYNDKDVKDEIKAKKIG